MSTFWWESVTGPATVVSDVVSLLGDGKCVALRLPSHIPWEEKFRDAVTEGLRRQQTTRGLVIEMVENGNTDNPEEVLLSFVLEDEALSWRPYRESLASFLQRTRALQGLLIWVKGLDLDGARRWAEVCAEMAQHTPSDGLILLECPDAHLAGMPEVCYSSLVSEYASRLFCANIADRMLTQIASDARKDYTAALLSRLCEGDVEFAVSLSSHYLPGRDEPLDMMTRIPEVSSDLADRGYAHVWEAQLECLFPIVEAERLRLVDEHATQLDELCEHGLTNAVGEPIRSRYEIEIGTLFWLSNNCCPSNMRLCNCDEKERLRIIVLRDCRNSLAHRHIVKEDLVRQLLD